jgi:hypothetical protein
MQKEEKYALAIWISLLLGENDKSCIKIRKR